MKEAIRAGLSAALVRSAATRLGRRLRRHDGTIILFGHRVTCDEEGYLQGLSPNFLREQLEYLTRHYEMIPLETLVECVVARKPAPPKSVVLTFDDGFRDNAEVAVPILDEFGVKATIFVVTRSLETGELPWSQRLGYLFQHTRASELFDPALSEEPTTLVTPLQRRAAYAGVKRMLIPLAREDRDRRIDDLADTLRVDPPNDRMMTWVHTKEAMDSGHAIGAHTYSHALLAQVSPEEARREMKRSRDDLRERLGIERPMFCFPAGSASDGLVMLARELGFRSAFRRDRARRLNRGTSDDPFALVRVGLPNGPAVDLEAELDGPFHPIRKLLGSYA